MKRTLSLLITATLVLAACSPKARNASQVAARPDIYPDYVGVTIPTGISPLDFTVKGTDGLYVVLKSPDGKTLRSGGKTSTKFPIKKWARLLQKSIGDSVMVSVSARKNGKWESYEPFGMYVSPDPIDYGLDYRLLEPGYEIYSHMGIYERELSTFKQRAIIENTQFDGCVNCHSFNHNDPSAMSLHIRGKHGATLLQFDGKLAAYNTKTDSTLGFCVYPYWHPYGNYIAYSTNSTRQGFHVQPDKIIEVFDLDSDMQVYDVRNNQIITAPQIKKEGIWESFPAFTPDGRTLFFTAAKAIAIPGELTQSHYNLMKVSFDPETGTIGNDVELVIDAASMSKSVCFPKPSYDGRYLMYTLCDYGTFSIWHHESDLWLLDLQTGETRPLDEVNSDDTDSYHNWSSNSRWFVFSSRRDDGLFTRPYIAHFDENGVAGKPFMLPQRDPANYYEDLFRSFNVPEFVTGPVKMNKIRAQKAINAPERVQFGFRWSD
ncbi:MAG: PD40 domain-containing protein [Bacteroidales bacterium]|nr:PD40 domain-containing protein [Bacteroidales bacterium]